MPAPESLNNIAALPRGPTTNATTRSKSTTSAEKPPSASSRPSPGRRRIPPHGLIQIVTPHPDILVYREVGEQEVIRRREVTRLRSDRASSHRLTLDAESSEVQHAAAEVKTRGHEEHLLGGVGFQQCRRVLGILPGILTTGFQEQIGGLDAQPL